MVTDSPCCFYHRCSVKKACSIADKKLSKFCRKPLSLAATPKPRPADGVMCRPRKETTSTKDRRRSRRCKDCAAAAMPGFRSVAKSSKTPKSTFTDARIPDGGISYSSRQKGSSRPAITAAALAALYNAGDYESEHVPDMWKYAKGQLHDISDAARSFGHWHYTYLYYSQVVYRQGDDLVETVSHATVRSDRQRTKSRRTLGRSNPSRLRHRLQPDHAAARSRLLADISALSGAICLKLSQSTWDKSIHNSNFTNLIIDVAD